MLKIIRTRISQGHKTISYPDKAPVLPDRFKGLPKIDSSLCPSDCDLCKNTCPLAALKFEKGKVSSIDLGQCIFCGECELACTKGAITFTRNHRMAAVNRKDLFVDETREQELILKLREDMLKKFGRSLKLRQVSAGGCNACEADLNVLSTIVFDLGRFGIQFVASPRHADGILVTGPVTQNMALALRKTYDAVPSPKIVIASGACAISGGPYVGHEEVKNGVGGMLPVDLYIPGCPPHPITALDGLLRLMGKIK